MIIFGFRDEMQVFSGGISGCDWPCSSISIAICLICFEGFFCTEIAVNEFYVIYIYTYIRIYAYKYTCKATIIRIYHMCWLEISV